MQVRTWSWWVTCFCVGGYQISKCRFIRPLVLFLSLLLPKYFKMSKTYFFKLLKKQYCCFNHPSSNPGTRLLVFFVVFRVRPPFLFFKVNSKKSFGHLEIFWQYDFKNDDGIHSLILKKSFTMMNMNLSMISHSMPEKRK